MKRFFAIAGLTLILSSILYFSFPGRHFDMKAYDIYSCLRGPIHPPDNIIIVGIDSESFSVINVPWPWPRGIHGKLIRSLNNSGARVIIMDIIFSDPSNTDEDKALAEAIQQHRNVVLAADLEIIKAEKFSQRILITPLEEFLNAGARFGISSIPVDSDNVVRRIFWGTTEAPSLEVSALEMLGISYNYDYRKMIHFTGPPYHIPYVPYYKALNHDIYLPEGFFKNKIVIVGKYSPQIEERAEDFLNPYRLHLQPPSPVRGIDMFATPFYILENKLMPGMEIHANMLFSLLNNDFLKPLRAIEAMILLIILSVSLTVINRNWSPLKSISLNVTFIVIYIVLTYLIFSKKGIFFPFASPIFAVFVNFISSGISSFVGIERKRRYLRKAFSLYLSPQVAQKVLEDPEKLRLGGQRVLATVLFSDLAGFTEMSEKVEPEEVVSILTRHTTEMTKIIFQYRGMLDKFIGDAIMAVWGTPVEDKDQAYHACLAALEMQRKMKNIADKISIPGYKLSMRIGINTGIVMAGNMGSEDRFDFTVIGDNVNIASRLEALNKLYGTEILISESTMEKIRGRLNVRELDLVRVKGKKQCIKVFELIEGEKKSFIDLFEEGLELYRRGFFDAAREKFSVVLKQNPEDFPSKLFIDRCDYLINSLNVKEWDGVWDFEIKS